MSQGPFPSPSSIGPSSADPSSTGSSSADAASPASPDAAPAAPASLIGRREACRRVGVSLTTWKRWQRAGRVRWGGRWGGPVPTPQGPRRRYAVDEVEQLAEELRRLGEPYPDPVRPGCYRVPLVGYLGEREAIVDADALPRIAGRRWAWSDAGRDHLGGLVVAAESAGVDAPPLRGVVLELPAGRAWRVSHANGDPLDCRRDNLIARTPSEQVCGARKMGTVRGRRCTSPYKGVTWEPSRGRWRVMICKDGRHRFLGRFRDEVAAAQAYDEAAGELFGHHARLNFPNGVDAALSRTAVEDAAARPPADASGGRAAA